MLTWLTQQSKIGYLTLPGEASNLILTAEFDDVARVERFYKTWQSHIEESAVPAQWLCAYSLACASQGNAEFRHYHKLYAQRLRSKIPNKYFKGNDRDIYAECGLFALWVPQVRYLKKDPAIMPGQLIDTALQFDIIAQLYARETLAGAADHIKCALMVNGSTMKYSRDNLFHVDYRGQFLPNFIRYYNTFTKLEIKKHG